MLANRLPRHSRPQNKAIFRPTCMGHQVIEITRFYTYRKGNRKKFSHLVEKLFRFYVNVFGIR